MYSDKFRLAASSLVLAAFLWFLIFVVRPFDFWVMMTFSTIALLLVAVLINGEKPSFRVSVRMVIIGLVSVGFLYGLFYSGFQIMKAYPIFKEGVARVYDLRSSAPSFLIGLVLVFSIAPGEEIYWRGLVQRRLAERLGVGPGLMLASTAYALVHLPTLNPPLILTALIGGLVWGYIYKTSASLVPGIISHIIFDLLIFLIAPMG